jgi:hypothetical protein
MTSSNRTLGRTLPDGDVFTTNPKTYDAFEEDIAVVQIFFKSPTIQGWTL